MPNFLDVDYFAARDDFRRIAQKAGARLMDLPISARGPKGEELSVDIAVLGSDSPRRILLHSSGVHGVEGLAGSAIQRAILAEGPSAPGDQAIVFIHAVNPYGMSWRRRWDEHGIDLNRNVLPEEEGYYGAPPLYTDLDSFLNPASPPALIDFYYLWATWLVLRHGLTPVQQAVAQGQYEYPRGLFYGGRQLAESPRLIIDALRPIVSRAEEVFQIDIHTGLGNYGEDLLLLEDADDAPITKRLRDALGPRIMAVDHPLSYRVRGSFPSGIAAHLPGPIWNHVTQEFGTYNPVYVLSCLREENRWHHYGGTPDDIGHYVKQRILETFVPADLVWQEKVLQRGKELFRDAMKMLAK